MSNYYQKEIPTSPVYVKGRPIKFDVLETADPVLIAELDNCIRRGIGGVIAITKEQYDEEVKKKGTSNVLESSSNQPRGRQELSAFHAQRAVEVHGKNSTVQFGADTAFAAPQREAQPSNVLPTSGRPMPDPIEVPSPAAFSGVFIKPPPTAKASKVTGTK